jgi:long-subunit acyl-CoA synthetase (AMP-forming)
MTDDVRTLCDIFLKASASGKADLLVSKVGGEWKGISAADFSYTVRALSMGLNALGIQPGDRAAIRAPGRSSSPRSSSSARS